MRTKPLALSALLMVQLWMVSCSPLDSAADLLNVISVKFSEGSPPVDGQTIVYTGSLLGTPSLDKFRFRMVFHVKADNSGNSHKAGFGSSALKPVLKLRIGSKGNPPISTPIEPFSVAAGKIEDLEFPIDVPLTLIDGELARKIADGDPIPYFLGGTLAFDLLDGESKKGSGSSTLDLASGEISTRPSGSILELLSRLL